VKDPALKDQFVELRAQGMSFAAIAERLDVAKSTLITWSKEAENDIGNLRQIYAEALREKYRMGAERRVELFAKQLDAVEGELAKRDMTTVPTERLFDMLLKLGREIGVQNPTIAFKQKKLGAGFEFADLVPTAEWQA
jgi:transposase-like protein